MDGNFQLKGRDKAGGETDAGLSTGLGIVIDKTERDEWCIKGPPVRQASQLIKIQALGLISTLLQESTCSGLAAVDRAGSKKSKGLHATGVAAASCARHGCFMKQTMVDFKCGEAYVIPDIAH